MSDKMKSSELRKLVRMFNKRTKITIPKGLKGQTEMIKFLEKHGEINHKNKVFLPNTQNMKQAIKLSDYDKMFPPKTEAQKAEAKDKAQKRKESSEANMVKTLEGKGYKITKPKTAEKKPTPAPKKPAKKAEPKKKAKMTEKEKKSYIADLESQSLKTLEDVDLKDLKKEIAEEMTWKAKRKKGNASQEALDEIAQRIMEGNEKLDILLSVIAKKKKSEKKPAPKKKSAPKKKEEKYDPKKDPVAMKVEFLKKAEREGDKLLSRLVNKEIKRIKRMKDKWKTLKDVQTEFIRVDKVVRSFIRDELKSGSDETDIENDFYDDMVKIYEDKYEQKISDAFPDKEYVSPTKPKKKGKK